MKKRALIIDDQESFCELIAIELKALGFETVKAGSANAGFEKFKAAPFDIIFCDARMEGLSGLDCLRLIRTKSPMVPAFVMMSGLIQGDVHEVYHEGADAYISKPIHRDDLAAITAKLTTPLATRWLQPLSLAKVAATLTVTGDDINTEDGVQFGRSGLFLAQKKILLMTSLRRGDGITIKLNLRQRPSISFQAKVVWRRDEDEGDLMAGLGLIFEHIGGDSSNFICRWIAENPVLFSIPRGNRRAA